MSPIQFYCLLISLLGIWFCRTEGVEPVLKHAGKLNLDENEIGNFKYKEPFPAFEHFLDFSEDMKSVEWKFSLYPEDPAWIQQETDLMLHSGKFSLDFVIDNMADRQMGVGFLLDWNIGPDWGFFGYLGSSTSAYAYDPSTGDIVIDTESIEGGLPTIKNNQGVITLELDLPRYAKGTATFIVDGIRTPSITNLPEGSVVIPAVCLLRHEQKITLQNFKREKHLNDEL